MLTVAGFESDSSRLLYELLLALHLRDMPDVAFALERHLLLDLPTHFERPAPQGGAWQLTAHSAQLVRELHTIAHDRARTADDCRAAIRQTVLMTGCQGTPS